MIGQNIRNKFSIFTPYPYAINKQRILSTSNSLAGNTEISKFLIYISFIFLLFISCSTERAWQQISEPKLKEIAIHLKNPPPEYAATVTWGWNGPMTEEVIRRDLESLYGRGFRAVTIEAGYRMDNAPYLSEEWFKLIGYAVEQARQLGMRVWIIDEGKYPSGFAGGKFSQERPELRMMGLAVAEKFEVIESQLIERNLNPEVVGIVAVNLMDQQSVVFDISNGKLHWKVPAGKWEIQIVDHQFRTPLTRAVNDSSGAKTTTNAMGNLLNPKAVAQFINWTHGEYKKHLGKELGKTVLGFRGDEPDFAHIPWTTGILDTFLNHKGYDVKPYLASFFASSLTDRQQRAKADYWDIWSKLFGKYFFGMQAEWCAQNNVEYMTHLNNEHHMRRLVRSTGDFFRPMRRVQIPGVDAIWNQVWPGKTADFVKLASSAAHLYGRPRALSESYAAYNPRPNTEQVLWGVNYQLVRGINLFEFMFYGSSAAGEVRLRGYMGEDPFPAVVAYTNSASYLLSRGRPAAKIGLYFPTMSYWLSDWDADEYLWKIARQLQEQQRDFDFLDEQAISSVMNMNEGVFTNLSGQKYTTILVPPISAISKSSLNRLRKFSEGGGTVIFCGQQPGLEVDKTFLNASNPDNLSWVKKHVTPELTSEIIEGFPFPDVKLDRKLPDIKYTHRIFRDGEIYFFFNEGNKPVSCQANLTGKGNVQEWDVLNGLLKSVPATVFIDGTVEIHLDLKESSSKFIVIGNNLPAL